MIPHLFLRLNFIATGRSCKTLFKVKSCFLALLSHRKLEGGTPEPLLLSPGTPSSKNSGVFLVASLLPLSESLEFQKWKRVGCNPQRTQPGPFRAAGPFAPDLDSALWFVLRAVAKVFWGSFCGYARSSVCSSLSRLCLGILQK